MIRAPGAGDAERSPPSCIQGFGHEVVPLKQGEPNVFIGFKLNCAVCSTSVFEISAFPLVAPDPSPYFEVKPGQTIYRPPHTLKCVHCAAERPLFDVRTQGYDGVLNGGAPYESGTEGKSFIAGQFNVSMVFGYSSDFGENSDAAREAHVAPSDLFDWLSIEGKSVTGGQDIDLGYECA